MSLDIKSHSLRKSDTSQYGLEIEKIDFSETLPIFNLYWEMNTNVKSLLIFLTVSMATTIFWIFQFFVYFKAKTCQYLNRPNYTHVIDT